MIDILLATYNGAPFIRRQLDSILEQSYTDWRLLIRDDGSKDDTARICHGYASKYPDKISIVTEGSNSGSATGNFAILLRHAGAGCVMFSDQDDVWLPHKVQTTLTAMHRLEAQIGPGIPALIYTDLQVTDGALSLLNPSLMRHLNRNPHLNNDPRRLCLESPVYGNTVMINPSLKQMIDGFPAEVVCYDWWLALIAVTFGRLEFVDQATSLFRRHGNTISAAGRHGLRNYLGKNLDQHRYQINRALKQCRTFYATFGPRMTSQNQALFAAAGRIPESSWLMRRYLVLRHRLFKTGAVKNLGLLAVV